MFKKIFLSSVLAFGIPLASTEVAYAADDNACAIWICLPGGFIPGCEKAYAAMIKRITSIPPKFPLPSFTSCFGNNHTGNATMRTDVRRVTESCREGYTSRPDYRREFRELRELRENGIGGSVCTNGRDSYVPNTYISHGAVNVTVNGDSYSYELSADEAELMRVCQSRKSKDRARCRVLAARVRNNHSNTTPTNPPTELPDGFELR